MKLTDRTIRAFLSQPENAAPLIRLCIRRLSDVRPEEIFTDDSSLTRFFLGSDGRYKAYAREADCIVLVRKEDFTCLVIIEVQSSRHLFMPIRALEYVSGVLSRQRKLIERRLRERIRSGEVKPCQEELLSGAMETDRLLPVFYLTLNISDDSWPEEGLCTRMSHDIRGERAAMPDWSPMDLDLSRFSDAEISKACRGSDCVHLYLLLSHRHDKGWIKNYLHSRIEVDGLTVMAICVCLGLRDIPQIGYKEKIDMCTVGRRIEEDYIAEGKTENLISNLRTIMRKLSITAEEAMDMLDVPSSERAAVLAAL